MTFSFNPSREELPNLDPLMTLMGLETMLTSPRENQEPASFCAFAEAVPSVDKAVLHFCALFLTFQAQRSCVHPQEAFTSSSNRPDVAHALLWSHCTRRTIRVPARGPYVTFKQLSPGSSDWASQRPGVPL